MWGYVYTSVGNSVKDHVYTKCSAGVLGVQTPNFDCVLNFVHRAVRSSVGDYMRGSIDESLKEFVNENN